MELLFDDDTTPFDIHIQIKASQILECLQPAAQEDNSDISLWELRRLSLTRGGLVNNRLRKQAWPKLLGTHLLIWKSQQQQPQQQHQLDDNGDDLFYHPTRYDTKQIKRLVKETIWSFTPSINRSSSKKKSKSRQEEKKEETASATATVSSTSTMATKSTTTTSATILKHESKNTSTSASTSANTNISNSNSNNKKIIGLKRRVSFDLPQHQTHDQHRMSCTKEERQVLRKVLLHLKRVNTKTNTKTNHQNDHSNDNRNNGEPVIFQGLQNLVAILMIVLESPSLASLVVQQLATFQWKQPSQKIMQPNTNRMDGNVGSTYLQLLQRLDPTLYRYFASHGLFSAPSIIIESWIPCWMAQDITKLPVLLRLWDVFMVSDPNCILLYFSVALTIYFRDDLMVAASLFLTTNSHNKNSRRIAIETTLAELPSRLDLDNVEKVLHSCLQSMLQHPLPLSATSPRRQDPYSTPVWVLAATAPSDWCVVQRAKELRTGTTIEATTRTSTSTTAQHDPSLILPSLVHHSYPLPALAMGLLPLSTNTTQKKQQQPQPQQPRHSSRRWCWCWPLFLILSTMSVLLMVANHSTSPQRAWLGIATITTSSTATYSKMKREQTVVVSAPRLLNEDGVATNTTMGSLEEIHRTTGSARLNKPGLKQQAAAAAAADGDDEGNVRMRMEEHPNGRGTGIGSTTSKTDESSEGDPVESSSESGTEDSLSEANVHQIHQTDVLHQTGISNEAADTPEVVPAEITDVDPSIHQDEAVEIIQTPDANEYQGDDSNRADNSDEHPPKINLHTNEEQRFNHSSPWLEIVHLAKHGRTVGPGETQPFTEGYYDEAIRILKHGWDIHRTAVKVEGETLTSKTQEGVREEEDRVRDVVEEIVILAKHGQGAVGQAEIQPVKDAYYGEAIRILKHRWDAQRAATNAQETQPTLSTQEGRWKEDDRVREAVEQSRIDAERLVKEAAQQSRDANEEARATVSRFLEQSSQASQPTLFDAAKTSLPTPAKVRAVATKTSHQGIIEGVKPAEKDETDKPAPLAQSVQEAAIFSGEASDNIEMTAQPAKSENCTKKDILDWETKLKPDEEKVETKASRGDMIEGSKLGVKDEMEEPTPPMPFTSSGEKDEVVSVHMQKPTQLGGNENPADKEIALRENRLQKFDKYDVAASAGIKSLLQSNRVLLERVNGFWRHWEEWQDLEGERDQAKSSYVNNVARRFETMLRQRKLHRTENSDDLQPGMGEGISPKNSAQRRTKAISRWFKRRNQRNEKRE